MLNQVSVFAENKKGALHRLTSVLANANINMYTMVSNDSAEYGIIRIIVPTPQEALQALQDAGYQCRLDQVLAIDMADTPGSLDKILDDLEAANVNINYLYISYNRQAATPVAIMKITEPEIEAFLTGKGYTLVNNF